MIFNNSVGLGVNTTESKTCFQGIYNYFTDFRGALLISTIVSTRKP